MTNKRKRIPGSGNGLKYRAVADELACRIKAGELLPGEKLPAEKVLCRQFDVSHLTVRRALTRLVEQGYAVRRQGAGTFVADRERAGGRIKADDFYVMIVTDSAFPFVARIIKAVESRAGSERRSVIICNTGADPRQEAAVVAHHIAAGFRKFVLMPVINDGVYYENLKSDKRLSLVFVDNAPRGCRIPAIKTDDVQGACRATEYLKKCGYRRIMHLAGPERFASARERCQGYAAAMGKRKKLVLPGAYSLRGGYNAVYGFMHDGHKLPAAIFAANDLMAAGAIRALGDLGLAVPDDVAVFGYGDVEPVAELFGLSTVRQDCARMGELCVEVLESSAYDLPQLRRRLVIEPELMIRKTA